MPNPKTDRKGYTTRNEDKERDMAAKGGPVTTLGRATGRRSLTSTTIDTQTRIAARSRNKNVAAKSPATRKRSRKK